MTSISEAYSYYWINQRIKERPLWETARMVAFYSGFGNVKGLKNDRDIQVFPWEEDKNKLLTPQEQKELIKSGKHPLVDKDGKRRNKHIRGV